MRPSEAISLHQPLTYLQNMGGRTEPFLYEREPRGIFLKPGVAFCLRRFQPLVRRGLDLRGCGFVGSH